MTDNSKIALIFAYYFSRFNNQAYKDLGYKTFLQATKEIGDLINVKPRTLQNMRDEFDPYHENNRVGWYQRPLSPSRKKVIQSLQNLSQQGVKAIIDEIISNPDFRNSTNFHDLLQIFSDKEDSKRDAPFIFRGRTGLKAEEFFLNHYPENKQPIDGAIVDKRQDGCGYDFEIVTNTGTSYFVEIKGMDDTDGGVLFTDKEWSLANKEGEKYFLVVVTGLGKGSSNIFFINNPAKTFIPKRKIYPVVRVDWTLSGKYLKPFLK